MRQKQLHLKWATIGYFLSSFTSSERYPENLNSSRLNVSAMPKAGRRGRRPLQGAVAPTGTPRLPPRGSCQRS
ncbi:MAG: hypothetical protein FWB93_06040 [Oscillospiraceae bacterium]|nr:hypothetical protein [Oscillospiraceae bacterium]